MKRAVMIAGLVCLVMAASNVAPQETQLQIPFIDNEGGTGVTIKFASSLDQIPVPNIEPQNTPSLTIGTVDALPGQEVIIPITLANPDFHSLFGVGLLVQFDPTTIDVLEIQTGSALDFSWFTSGIVFGDLIAFSAISFFGPVVLEGEICRIRVRVKDGVGTKFTPINFFGVFLINSVFSFIEVIPVNGGINITQAAPPPPAEDPVPVPTEPPPPSVQDFVTTDLSLSAGADGSATITITPQEDDSATDSSFADQTEAFINDLKTTISFTDSTFSETTTEVIDGITFTIETRIGSDGSGTDASGNGTPGTSVTLDASTLANQVLVLAGGNGSDGLIGGSGGFVTGFAGNGSIIVAIGGNGGDATDDGGAGGSGGDATATGSGGTGGDATTSLTGTETGGQVVALGGDGGNGTCGNDGGKGGNAKTVAENSTSDLRSVGGNGGNGGDGCNDGKGGNGGHGGHANNATGSGTAVSRATGGNGGNGGNGGDSDLGDGGNGGKGGNGGNAIAHKGINEAKAFPGTGGNGGSGGQGLTSGSDGNSGKGGNFQVAKKSKGK